ncbi:MAG TPA: serine/threonine-protein kinase, partial [Gemmataceae bacterium]|nr:serine/threonine-protein kinase [Gemmataceae bacterium]
MTLDTSKPVLQSIGPYDLVEKVAEGGMGSIYRGRNRDTGQVVAVKIMAPHVASNKVLLKRFEQEFRAASRLDHPNIVRALDYGEANAQPYLVMEFVEGESLGARIERDGRMPETEAIRVIAQVAQALHRAHKQGLIHRDVKPDNILVTKDGQAKLADLGLVKETEADLNLTRTGRGLGTPHFMAPEQFRNAKNATVQCDVYSLGATLYQMVTGELPFRSAGPLDAFMKKIQGDLTPPRQLMPDLSERVDWAIRRAMSADPEHRPASCREFIEDLTGHTTRRLASTDTGTGTDIWYMVYKDDEGEVHTVKGSTAAIRRSLRDGVLGDAANVRASRVKAGPFEPLRGYPEFRDLVVTPS